MKAQHPRHRDDGYRRRIREMKHFFPDEVRSGERSRIQHCTVGVVLQHASQDEVAFYLRRLFEQDGMPCRVRPWEFACASPEPLQVPVQENFNGIDLIPTMNPQRNEIARYQSLIFITRPNLLAMKRLYHTLGVLADYLNRRPISLIMADACDTKRASLYLSFLRDSIFDNLRLHLRWAGMLCERSRHGISDCDFRPLAEHVGRPGEFPRRLLPN